eukprot:s1968_g12.t1
MVEGSETNRALRDVPPKAGIRKLKEAEVLEVLSWPTKHEESGLHRLKVKAKLDGAIGWITQASKDNCLMVLLSDAICLMPHSNDVQDAVVSAEDPGGLSTTPASVRGISLQQAADILVRAIKEAQCCEGILRSHVVNLEAELEARNGYMTPRGSADCFMVWHWDEVILTANPAALLSSTEIIRAMGAVSSRNLQLAQPSALKVAPLWLAVSVAAGAIAYWTTCTTLKTLKLDASKASSCSCGHGSSCEHKSDSSTAADGTDGSEDEKNENDLEDLASDNHSRPPLLGMGQVLRKPRPTPETTDAIASDQSILPGRQRIHVKTFGCPHNQSDGEYLAGQLKDYGYTLVDSLEESDAIVINSCTVKHPSETRALNLVSNAQQLGKGVVLAGCVPSSNRQLADKLEVSMLDVTQLDRIVEVVEETVKGNTVKLMDKRSDLPSLSLPKVRKHRFAEIITINAGCLGSCTYCKTKMSRGKVVSYPIDTIIERALESAREGVSQIELASEDMGAYGLDIGTNIAELLKRLSDALLRDYPGVMLRTGMTNPPFIMQHVDEIIEVLNRPNVHAFMHIPVQSGSDQVLRAMRREYTVAEFSYLADRLKAEVPEMFLLTDIICGFPTESEEDWEETMALCKKYKFQGIHISQFYARPGTSAARLKPLKSHIGKDRYKELADLVTSYDRNEHLLGREERVWFGDTEQERSKGVNAQGQTVGRTKSFAKVLAARKEAADSRRIAEEAKAENQQLKAKAESLGKLVAKQQQGRLRAFSARTVGAMLARKNGGGVKRPRLTDHEGSPKKVPEQVKGEPNKTGKGKVLEDKTNLMGKAALAPFRSLTPAPKLLEAERQKLPECHEFKPSFEGSEERSEREKSGRSTESTNMAFPEPKEMGSDAEDAADAEDGRLPECDGRAGRPETKSSRSGLKVAQVEQVAQVAQVAGLRIWGGCDPRRFVPKEREEAGQTERTLEKLEAEEQSEKSERRAFHAAV